jgi:hypothetical protein
MMDSSILERALAKDFEKGAIGAADKGFDVAASAGRGVKETGFFIVAIGSKFVAWWKSQPEWPMRFHGRWGRERGCRFRAGDR